MSIAMIQAFKKTGVKPTDRLVAYMLADHHNDGTGRCDPSVPLLMQETGLDARSITRAMQRLEQAGHITVRRLSGSRNTYDLHPVEEENPRQSAATPPAESRHRQKVAPGTESGLPPAQSRDYPRQKVATPPAESRPNRKEPELNPKSNHNEAALPLLEIFVSPESIGLDPSLPQELHEAWDEWQTYRQGRAKAKGKKLAWTEQSARMGAKQVASYAASHGWRMVCDRIASAIGGSWQGLNLDKMNAPTRAQHPTATPTSPYGPVQPNKWQLPDYDNDPEYAREPA